MATKKAKKDSGPAHVVAYEIAGDGMTETIRIDNLRPTEGETAEQSNARATRLGWARKSLAGWAKSPNDPEIARVMSDGGRFFGPTLGEVRDALDDCAELKWEIKASAPIPLSDMPKAAAPIDSKAATIGKLRADIAAIQGPEKPGAKRLKVEIVTEDEARAAMTPEASTAHHRRDTCGCGVCCDMRDAKRGVPLTGVQASTALAVTAETAPEAMGAEAMDPHAGRAQVVYTIGYDGGISVGRFFAILTEHKIDLVVDIRPKNTGHAAGWSESALRNALLSRYVRVEEIEDLGTTPKRVMVLRRQEAPGDSTSTLHLARSLALRGVPVVHLYRNEYIEGRSLQDAIDADERDGGDHAYDCIVDTGDDDAERAQASA